MTKKGYDKLSDPKQVQDAGTRGYKGEPEPADPPTVDPTPPVERVPVGQEDAGGMKSVEEKSGADAVKDAE